METQDAPNPWCLSTTAVFEGIRRRVAAGEAAVVATVVSVEGSAYRRPGAKMLVDADDGILGAVTPGCLEDPLVQRALSVRESGEATTETFDLTGDDDAWGFGLGCNGVVTVLLEPLSSRWERALDALADGGARILVTVVESDDPSVPLGAGTALDATGTAVDGAGDLPPAVLDRVARIVADGESAAAPTVEAVETDAGSVSAFVDPLTPPTTLLIFGSQGDVHPVARLGRQVGFRVIVASPRGAKATADAFPDAHAVRGVRAPETAAAVDDPERTYPVLMSHNFVDDQLALASLLDTAVPYIGLMGPQKRFERMREALADDGVTLSATDRDRVATPVGLDLGGDEPIQIAMSVVGEVLAVSNDADGSRLRSTDRPIHRRNP
ncbi:XdhC family protein [Haloferacaceae archaeon DSL9]